MPHAQPADAPHPKPPQPDPLRQEPSARPTDAPPTPTITLGCVSYLNAKPLIHGLDHTANPAHPPVRLAVPADLLAWLEAGEVDMALCPVIDFFRARTPLELVPVGGIGCEGPTLTVRLFSRVPIDHITVIHADTDSHTSVALVQVLLHAMHGLQPTMIDYRARNIGADGQHAERPEAMLLIGDKVVTDAPNAAAYPHQLDLGEAWHRLTGLPFVFAIWMARVGASLGDTPGLLAAQRERNVARVHTLADLYAEPLGWPRDLALEYLGGILHYHTGPRELQAIQRFGEMAHAMGLIATHRPLRLYDAGATARGER